MQASNPGTFENDCDHFWLRASNEVIYRHVSSLSVGREWRSEGGEGVEG